MSVFNPLTQELLEQLSELENKRILVFGDVGLDEYVQGEVARISPEAPVPVVEVASRHIKLGLSANVAANVKSLGGEPLLFSLVGQDSGYEDLSKLLKDQGISNEYLMVDSSRSTTQKMRVMSGHHHIVRVDYENKNPVDVRFLTQHKPALEKALQTADCVIIQDYAKGLVNQVSAQMVVDLAKAAGKPVLVDPYRSTPLEVYKGCDFMTPNKQEAFELAKQIAKPTIWQDANLIGTEFMELLGAPQMVITLGAQGMLIFDKGDIFSMPTFAKTVFDVTGAGDTVIAAFALAKAANWPMKKAGLFANMAAGVVVGHVGAIACSTEDLIASLKQNLS